MKKIWFLILCLVTSLSLLVGEAHAYVAESLELITSFESNLANKNTKEKSEYLETISQLLSWGKLTGTNNNETIVNDLQSRLSTKEWDKPTTGFYLSGGKWSIEIPFVNIDKVREAWLSWHNQERSNKWLDPLSYHSELERTATEWSQKLTQKYTGHRRDGVAGYYNYNGIMKWFADRGVNFEKQTNGRSTFSESIGYRYYKCSNGDCTQKLIDSTRKIFNAYLKEWNNWVHYRAIVMPQFTQMGIGMEVDPTTNMVYTTIHYGVDLVK